MTAAIAAVLAAALVAADGDAAGSEAPPAGRGSARPSWPPQRYPAPASLRAAEDYAASRIGVSFAVFDSLGRLRGYDVDRAHSSASASKVLLLAAELRRLRSDDEPLDAYTRSTLTSMITYSDNGAADFIYTRVGDAGMEDVAARAGMRSFTAAPGFWGGVQITAADMARFYLRLNRNLVGPHRRFARGLLAGVTPAQRWGIPAAAGDGWRVWFKGGWRPAGEDGTSGAVTHQASLLRHRGGVRISLAVLTDSEPTELGGIGSIEGVTSRLLSPSPAGPSAWSGV
ncbi:MAG: hypothetical protein EXQ70_02655 [Solirubrobacterales bacterium]|nr:hypothetical protein [Solirubrobacterales bacterium]